MTYYTDQIVSAQRTIADALSGKRLRESIRQLQDRSKIKDSLKAAPARGAITAKKKVGKRTVASGQLVGPFTETVGTRTFHETERELRSADSLFIVSYFNVKDIQMQDGSGALVTFSYVDYTAS